MNIVGLQDILDALCQEEPAILLAMLVSRDGLSLCHAGNADDVDTTGALYTELTMLCDRILGNLSLGASEHIFVRARGGCVTIWPVAEVGVLACTSTSDISNQKLQMVAWKAVAALVKHLP